MFTTLAESGVLFCLPSVVHLLLSDVGLSSDVQSCQTDLDEGYLACYRRTEVGWNDEAHIGWLLYVR